MSSNFDVAPGFTPTRFRQPKTGERKLQVQFRNGQISKHTYSARQLRWTDEGSEWDIIAVRLT